MALQRSSRGLNQSVTLFSPRLWCCPQCTVALRVPRRMASNKAPPSVPKNPVIEQYMKKKPSTRQQYARQQADIKHSIFADLEAEQERENPRRKRQRNREHMNYVLDPDPAGRMLWERNRVIEQIRRRGRLTKTQLLKRTERESLSKSAWIKTSVKKLGALARQIAGKPIEEAIIQMRFSPKKAAEEVKKHLEQARDAAVVERGMGLGEAEGTKGDPVEIQLKDEKRKRITDRTSIYIDQAWVGRGQYGFGYDYRARGRLNTLRLPWTSISVLLKEERTRIRLAEERQKKIDRKKLWVQLPDRPITLQRQYPLW